MNEKDTKTTKAPTTPKSSTKKAPKKPAKKAAPKAATAGRQARLAVDLPDALHRALKVKAAQDGKTIRDVIVGLLSKVGIK